MFSLAPINPTLLIRKFGSDVFSSEIISTENQKTEMTESQNFTLTQPIYIPAIQKQVDEVAEDLPVVTQPPPFQISKPCGSGIPKNVLPNIATPAPKKSKKSIIGKRLEPEAENPEIEMDLTETETAPCTPVMVPMRPNLKKDSKIMKKVLL